MRLMVSLPGFCLFCQPPLQLPSSATASAEAPPVKSPVLYVGCRTRASANDFDLNVEQNNIIWPRRGPQFFFLDPASTKLTSRDHFTRKQRDTFTAIHNGQFHYLLPSFACMKHELANLARLYRPTSSVCSDWHCMKTCLEFKIINPCPRLLGSLTSLLTQYIHRSKCSNSRNWALCRICPSGSFLRPLAGGPMHREYSPP